MKLVAVEGSISAGKSTALQGMKDQLEKYSGESWKVIKEPVDEDPKFHALLKDFIKYQDDPVKRIKFQLYMTEQRSELLKEIPDGNYIIERSLFSDIVFSQLNFLSMEKPTGHYMKYFYHIKDKLKEYPQVDTVVYLRRDPDACYETCLERNRDGEDGYTLEYFEDVHNFHDACLPQIAREYDTNITKFELGKGFFDPDEEGEKLYESVYEGRSE